MQKQVATDVLIPIECVSLIATLQVVFYLLLNL